MSYSSNIQSYIESADTIIAKCEQMLSLKSLEPHMINAWQAVLEEAEENKLRLEQTKSMECFKS